TQASTKVYPGSSGQTFAADVAAGGLLVALPDPVVPFAGARYRQRATIRLDASASIVWLEAVPAGRTARGERWAGERYASHTHLERAGALLAADGLLLDPAHGPLGPRLGRFDALATLLVVGPAVESLRAALLSASSTGGSTLVAPSPLGEDGALVRIAAEHAEALARTTRSLLAPLVQLLGDDPLGPPQQLTLTSGLP